jgi:hypothetical protein
MTTQTVNLSIVELTYDSGKSEIKTMTVQQLAGLRKSKVRKTIISKRKLATIEIKIKHLNKPL